MVRSQMLAEGRESESESVELVADPEADQPTKQALHCCGIRAERCGKVGCTPGAAAELVGEAEFRGDVEDLCRLGAERRMKEGRDMLLGMTGLAHDSLLDRLWRKPRDVTFRQVLDDAVSQRLHGGKEWATIAVPEAQRHDFVTLCSGPRHVFATGTSIAFARGRAIGQSSNANRPSRFLPSPVHLDIATLLFAMTVCMVTMAVALPAVIGQVNEPARRALAGVVVQGAAWALLLMSGLAVAGSMTDRVLSTLAMAGITGGLALNAAAFDLWCGREPRIRAPLFVALVMPLGYAIGFSSYPFRVGWANGLLTLQMALLLATVWRKPAVPVGRWRWLLVVSLLAQMIVTLWRGILGAFFTESYPTFLSPHPVNYAFAIIANATTVLSLMAVLLAHRDEAARELERLATLDGLTGVLNRGAWMSRAATELAVSVRYAYPVAVLMIDLDHFKQINDTRGHAAGDRALAFVARALEAAVRPGDLVGRYGGEEFCVLMNHAENTAANAFDARLRAYLDEVAERELGFPLAYSAGIAVRSSPGDALEAMLKRADDTLYSAKAQGRSRTLDAHDSRLQAA